MSFVYDSQFLFYGQPAKGGGEVPYAPQILGFGGEAESGKFGMFCIMFVCRVVMLAFVLLCSS